MPNTRLDQQIGDGLEQATRHQLAGETETALLILEKLENLTRPVQNPGLAYVLIQKSGWLRELGRIGDAKAALQEAEEVCQGMPRGQAPLSSLRMEQGIVARRAGDAAGAEILLKEAQGLAAGSPIEIVVMSDILANLAAAYADQGRLEEAQKALTSAMGYDLRTGDQRALANNLNMLGLMYFNAGDRSTARAYLTRSKAIAARAGLAKELADATQNLAIVADAEGRLTDASSGLTAALAEAVRAGRQEDIASAKSSLGILAARGGRFLEAKDLLIEAHATHSRLGLDEFTAIDLLNLSQTEFSLGNGEAALDAAREALEIAQRAGLLQILWAVHHAMARAQSALAGRADASEEQRRIGLEESLVSYGQAADAIDLVRAGIGRPWERTRLLVGKEAIYQEAMLLAGLFRRGNTAWSFAERARGRAFLDSLGAKRIDQQAARDPLSARRSELTNHLLSMADANGPDGQALLDELRVVRSRIIAEQPAIAAVTEAAMPSIQEIAAVIAPDTAVVEFVVGPGNRLTVFVLTRDGFAAMHTAELGTIDLRREIEQFRVELQQEVPGEPAGKVLFLILFMPVWDVLGRFDRLLIVPHRELHHLPFAALWFDNVGEGPKRLYLCQRFDLSTIASASHLVHALDQPRSDLHERDAIVLGNPTRDLPGSEAEARVVARMLKATPLLREEASRARLLPTSGKHSVIHIASHGIYDEADPLLSGVVLADGRLSVEDLLETRLDAGLLTLSGCVTGVSMHEAGDELIGLSRAALVAGVPSVITTLWDVRDDSAAIFFEGFYGYLTAGIGKASALGMTQRAMLDHPRYANPVHWAPFVLLGDSR